MASLLFCFVGCYFWKKRSIDRIGSLRDMEEQGKEEKKASIELKTEEKEKQDFTDRNSPGDGEK